LDGVSGYARGAGRPPDSDAGHGWHVVKWGDIFSEVIVTTFAIILAEWLYRELRLDRVMVRALGSSAEYLRVVPFDERAVQ